MTAAIDNTSANKRLAKELSTLLWSGKYDEFEAHCTADYVGHDPAVPDGMRTVADVRDQFDPIHDAMSDVTYEVLDVVAEGDHVFHRGRVSGIHTGEYMGMPATNERISIEDHIEWRFEDGKLAESWAQYDAMGVMRQIGMDVPGAN
ncbi:ester cyclase [Halorubellus litoreus]|uniref:Ester cyclase n=1 Tax=Halorubellus litoreus TaxID=755308 RepID=A0ABD5V909_9EURY